MIGNRPNICGAQHFCGTMESKGAKLLKTKTLEMGGIHRREFVEYFLQLADEAQEQETFKGCGWEVQVGQETWSSLGIYKICHVRITFQVEEELFDQVLSQFQLRFLRAGG